MLMSSIPQENCQKYPHSPHKLRYDNDLNKSCWCNDNDNDVNVGDGDDDIYYLCLLGIYDNIDNKIKCMMVMIVKVISIIIIIKYWY